MWKNLTFNKQNIQAETEKAVLINCHHKSEFYGYSFWHPSKLIREGSHSFERSLGYMDDFKIILKKYGKWRYNWNSVIDEKSITIEEF